MSTQIDLLKKYRIQITGRWGQHLLTDPNIQKKVVALLDLQPDDFLLEIGPGLGALTFHAAPVCRKFAVVEKDPRFIEILKEELPQKEVAYISGDVCKLDFRKMIADTFGTKKKIKVLSNLPYYATTPILFLLIDNRDLISSAVLTMQKEVAHRIIALPATKDYGRLTLGVRYAAEVRHAFDISARCFVPPPEIDSSVLVFHFTPPALEGKLDEKFMFEIVQTAFAQRRKTLVHNLLNADQLSLERSDMLAILKKLGLKETVRGEELSLKDYVALTGELERFCFKKKLTG